MRLTLLFAVAISTSLLSCSQDIPASKVPSVVLNTVQLKFPGSTSIEWEKKKSQYEAEFNIDSTEHNVFINENGEVIWYKTKIKETALPPQIISAITREQQGYTIDEIEKISTGDSTYYLVEVELKGKKDKELLYASDGTSIQNIELLKLFNVK